MRKIALIGGDSRQISAAFTLKTAGFTPFVYGNDMAAGAGFTAPYTLEETLGGATAVLLPVPSVKKDGFLYTPLWERSLKISDFIKALPQEATVFLWGKQACRMDLGNPVVDLEKDEICQTENAVLTADIAIFLAMKETKLALCDMRASILGYGRIGKCLARHLLALGATVRIGARRQEVQQEAREAGFAAYMPTDAALICDTDVIFNTIPYPILTSEHLACADIGTLYMELASHPGALTENAKSCPLCIFGAAGLPGKYCARSAGKIIAKAVLRHLDQKRGAVW